MKTTNTIRERAKNVRRESILASAENLIRKTGSVEFTLDQLAKEAIVSIGTIYNLIGSKPAVMHELMIRSMDLLDSIVISIPEDDNSWKRALVLNDTIVKAFTDDPTFFRALYGYILGADSPDDSRKLLRRAIIFWKKTLKKIYKSNEFPPSITLYDFAREHQIYFAGALELWVLGELNDEGFKWQSRYSAIWRLLGIADENSKNWLLKELKTAKNKLSKSASRIHSVAPAINRTPV